MHSQQHQQTGDSSNANDPRVPKQTKLQQETSGSDDLIQLQRTKIREVLHRLQGNKSQAARALGINRRKLYRLLEKHEINEFPGDVKSSDVEQLLEVDPLDPSGAPAADDLAGLLRTKIVEVMRREQGNKSRAARILGVSRRKLYRLLEKYGLEQPDSPFQSGVPSATVDPQSAEQG